jgi:hypothetical protein
MSLQDPVSVDSPSFLLNSARLHRVFQNFVVPWKKTHVSKTNYINRSILTRHVDWCKGCLCKFLQQMCVTTRLKIKLKLR